VEPQTLEIELVPGLSGQALEDFERIFEGAFPPAERAPTASLVDSIGAGTRLLVAGLRGGRLVAMAVFLPLTGDALGIQFLEYLAVDSSERGGGIGSALLPMCLQLLRDDERGRLGIVLEVEAPEAAGDPEDRDLRMRRIRFYRERNGAVLVDHAPRYLVPDLSGEGDPLHFHLMWLAADGPRQLTGALLRACVQAILTQSYELNPYSPLTTDNLDRLTPSRR
jgi:GNAT superfamily N-acetyltransferase